MMNDSLNGSERGNAYTDFDLIDFLTSQKKSSIRFQFETDAISMALDDTIAQAALYQFRRGFPASASTILAVLKKKDLDPKSYRLTKIKLYNMGDGCYPTIICTLSKANHALDPSECQYKNVMLCKDIERCCHKMLKKDVLLKHSVRLYNMFKQLVSILKWVNGKHTMIDDNEAFVIPYITAKICMLWIQKCYHVDRTNLPKPDKCIIGSFADDLVSFIKRDKDDTYDYHEPCEYLGLVDFMANFSNFFNSFPINLHGIIRCSQIGFVLKRFNRTSISSNIACAKITDIKLDGCTNDLEVFARKPYCRDNDTVYVYKSFKQFRDQSFNKLFEHLKYNDWEGFRAIVSPLMNTEIWQLLNKVKFNICRTGSKTGFSIMCCNENTVNNLVYSAVIVDDNNTVYAMLFQTADTLHVAYRSTFKELEKVVIEW